MHDALTRQVLGQWTAGRPFPLEWLDLDPLGFCSPGSQMRLGFSL